MFIYLTSKFTSLFHRLRNIIKLPERNYFIHLSSLFACIRDADKKKKIYCIVCAKMCANIYTLVI